MHATSMLKRAFALGMFFHGVMTIGVCSRRNGPRMALGVSHSLPERMEAFLVGRTVLVFWLDLTGALGAGVSRAASPASLMKLSPKLSGGSHPDTSISAS